MQIPAFSDQIPAKPPLLCETWGFGTNGGGVCGLFLYSESHRYNKSRATITKKKIIIFTEEVAATITVGVLLCLINP